MNTATEDFVLPKQFSLEIEMLSDWHVGSGHGRPGDLDRLVRRDHDGLPFIGGKTLTAIWRDACEQMAFTLDGGSDTGPWMKWVVWLFGAEPSRPGAAAAGHRGPQAAALQLRSARLDPDLRSHLRTVPGPTPARTDCANGRTIWDKECRRRDHLRAALTLAKPGVAIDPASGAAKTDFLRFDEMAPGGLVLSALDCEWEPPVKLDQRRVASALLLAGLAYIERLGGKRRRGAGACLYRLPAALCPKAAADWLEGMLRRTESPPDTPEEARTAAVVIGPTVSSGSDQGWQHLELSLELTDPVMVRRALVGNVVESLDFIPGTYLLGQVTKAIGLSDHAAIAAGAVVVAPATIELKGGSSWPAPSVWHSLKEEVSTGEKRTFNRLVEPEPDRQANPIRGGYIPRDPGDWARPCREPVRPPMLVATHNSVEDKSQRPTEEVGGVFSYQAIAAGTVLRLELLIRDDQIARLSPAWFHALEELPVRLGSAKKDEYGGAILRRVRGPVRWQRAPADDPGASGDLVVWLASDTLITDAHLRPDTTLSGLARALSAALGVTLEAAVLGAGDRRQDDAPTLIGADLRTRRIESWQQRWQLPRPSLVAIQSGSCAVFRVVSGSLTAEALASVEAAGIGERRAEGYGRVRFNDPRLMRPFPIGVSEPPKSSDLLTAVPLVANHPAFAVARQIELRTWRRLIRDRALHIAIDAGSRKTLLGLELGKKPLGLGLGKKPSASQLGALREQVRALDGPLAKGADHPLVTWLGKAQERDHWPREAANKLITLLADPDCSRLWEHFGAGDDDAAWPVMTATGGRDLQRLLWFEALITLIDALVHAHKRAGEA
ncbi:MAG: hypothetical protein GC191_08250 [Azospirillum sp.]|nr:hypothetical protein [Azospirillum sp.]